LQTVPKNTPFANWLCRTSTQFDNSNVPSRFHVG
jgi:hypothetical protein